MFAAFTMASTSNVVMSPRTMSILAAGFFNSGRQPFDEPVMIGLSCITKAIVQTIRASLPEFHRIGSHSISTPVLRQRNTLVAKTFCHLCHSRVQDAAPIEDLALTRGPRAELAAERA